MSIVGGLVSFRGSDNEFQQITATVKKKSSVEAKDPFSLELFSDSLFPTHEVQEECKESESEDSAGQKSIDNNSLEGG